MDSTTRRYFIEIAFDGRAYHGWQLQPNAPTVQEVLDRVLGTILRQPIATVGCGRTDAGVHATQLYAHFDVVGPVALAGDERFLYNVNSLLPPDIAAKRVIAVARDAHARFDAVKRSYTYQLHFQKDPFLQGRSWYLRDVPDVEAMNQAGAILLGYEDFSCFSKSNTQVYTNNCRVVQAEWEWQGDQHLAFHISADRFLRNMVRAIVGTSLEIGRGLQPVSHMHTVIQSRNRSMAGTSVPAYGLFLTEVVYPYL